jgi:hypothetical protein
MVEATQQQLARSHAGMRLIAQTTLYNRGDFERLRTYIADNYRPEAFEVIAAKDRLLDLKMTYRVAGKLRIRQVVAVGPHRVVAMMQGQKNNSMYLAQIAVEEDYPHKVLAYHHQLLGEMETNDEHQD